MTTVADPRWTPVLRGNIYCSPACGGRCTKAAYDKAVADCEQLCHRLGFGWKGTVWENLGWHYNAIRDVGEGTIAVYPSVPGGFHCMIGKDGNGTFNTHSGSFDDPTEAVRAEWEAYKEHVGPYIRLKMAVEELLK